MADRAVQPEADRVSGGGLSILWLILGLLAFDLIEALVLHLVSEAFS